jgi:rhamnose transport system substrate-binding protein
MIASGDLKGVAGEQFEAGRMGTFTIEKDPTRPDVANALRVLMGPFSKYDKNNIDKAVSP